MILIDGKKIADRIKDEIVAEILAANNGNIHADARPHLAIVLVGVRPDSELYVSLKEREAKKVGVDTTLYRLPEDAHEAELEEVINFLNNDSGTDAILLQLPLPDHMNADKIIALMNPKKDVDGFHPENLAKINCTGSEIFVPPLGQVVLEILEEAKIDPAGLQAVVIANSDVFGETLGKILQQRGAKVEISSPDDKDLADKISEADILVSAAGVPGLIKGEQIKKNVCIIDVGITKTADGKIKGDADAESVKDKAGYLTPVPGGVGPITIATALANTVKIWKKNKKTE
ncbi:MAG: bifunctional 5,10-methylenetetrahydrofolate dehydrogenase/5,10-methenyltetrahydrofolate cyclohydrolase [Patescibacteria group bacterium]|jgi:methylenetetrahydrofolate dehydrogenase (NADP+)/methenyltetrahydrofolate cyclohydrolase